MARVIDVDMDIKAKRFATALGKFFNRNQSLKYWKETFEYMYEHNENFFCDNKFADGTKNNDWSYALHLDHNDDWWYFAVIERA